MLHPVIQESIVAYFLKTGKKYMQQVTADELCMFQGDLTLRFMRFSPLAEKVTVFSVRPRILLLEMAIISLKVSK